MIKNEIINIMVKSFNDGTDNGIFSVIEIAENIVKSDNNKMSLVNFIELIKGFQQKGIAKITEEQCKEKFKQ